MSRAPAPRAPGRARIWACFFAPSAAWFLLQQGQGYLVRVACSQAGPPLGAAFGVAALVVCAAAALFAAPVARSRGETTATRRFIARLAIAGGGMFALAIAYQTAATLLVPSCVR
jgi:hypothetical protein